jgi:hypothetical protein
MRVLAETLQTTSRTLADIAAVRLAHDDAEPDFIRAASHE